MKGEEEMEIEMELFDESNVVNEQLLSLSFDKVIFTIIGINFRFYWIHSY